MSSRAEGVSPEGAEEEARSKSCRGEEAWPDCGTGCSGKLADLRHGAGVERRCCGRSAESRAASGWRAQVSMMTGVGRGARDGALIRDAESRHWPPRRARSPDASYCRLQPAAR